MVVLIPLNCDVPSGIEMAHKDCTITPLAEKIPETQKPTGPYPDKVLNKLLTWTQQKTPNP